MAPPANNSEPRKVRREGDNCRMPISVSRRQLCQLVRNAEELLGGPIDGNQAALRHLRGYIDLLLGPDGIANDPPLIAHIGATLADLTALVIRTGCEGSQLAQAHSLRAARLNAIKADIAAHLHHQDLTVSTVAA